jgi:hypothetical protein
LALPVAHNIMDHAQMTQTNPLILVAQLMLGGLCMFGCSGQSQPAQSQPAQSPSGRQSATAPNVPGDADRVAPSEQLPDWSLGESDFQSLGSPYKMAQFEICPPASFRFIKSLDEPKTHSTTYYWVGPVRKDETYPQFFVIITGLSPRHSSAPLANLLDDVLRGIQRHRQDWQATPAEYGSVGGLTFARSSWSGIATSAAREGLAGRTMHGVVYLTVHDNQVVQIMRQDVAPDHAEWLKQGEVAALSFRVAAMESTSP